ncbi:hypothetical protein BH11VER1_BH11VER1_36900 [soil metagenome]
MRLLNFSLILFFVSGVCGIAAESLPSSHFYDESTNRYVTLDFSDFKKVKITFRFTGSPGASSRWFGDGEKKDKEISFAQTVGEEGERGTYFIAKGGESKLEIGFKPGQATPQDAGINGVYRHITEEKRLSLAKKEADAAVDYMNTLFKTAAKGWSSEDKPVIADWRNQWPALQNKWMKLTYLPPVKSAVTPPKPAIGGINKPGEVQGPEKQADYWIAMVETTGLAINFFNQQNDKLISPGWDGDYDDGFGGHVSLKLQSSGKLRINLNFSRAGDAQTGEMGGEILPENIKSAKDRELSATFINADAEVADAAQQARVTIRRVGHYLYVATEKIERYTARGWFDGIYRWMPPPPN